jgi:hypothetical protein
MSYLGRLLPLAVAGALALGPASSALAAAAQGEGWRDASLQLADGWRGEWRGRGHGWGPPPPRWRGPPPRAYYAPPPPRYYYPPPPVVYYPPPPRYYYPPPPPPPGIGLYFRF